MDTRTGSGGMGKMDCSLSSIRNSSLVFPQLSLEHKK